MTTENNKQLKTSRWWCDMNEKIIWRWEAMLRWWIWQIKAKEKLFLFFALIYKHFNFSNCMSLYDFMCITFIVRTSWRLSSWLPMCLSARLAVIFYWDTLTYNLLVKSVRKPLFSEEKIIFSVFWENRKKKLINSVLFFRFLSLNLYKEVSEPQYLISVSALVVWRRVLLLLQYLWALTLLIVTAVILRISALCTLVFFRIYSQNLFSGWDSKSEFIPCCSKPKKFLSFFLTSKNSHDSLLSWGDWLLSATLF